MNTTRKMTAFRLPPSTIAKADRLATEMNTTKTAIVVEGIDLVADKVAKANKRAIRRCGEMNDKLVERM